MAVRVTKMMLSPFLTHHSKDILDRSVLELKTAQRSEKIHI